MSLAVGAAGLAVRTTAKSYAQILGSNNRLNFAVIGLNGRGYAHLSALKANRNAARISYVCDVDSNILEKFADATRHEMGEAPVAEKDFRKVLQQKNVDAITIATPDHWHTPIAIAGLQAGKHVYVEKPCSHNPAEGEMLIEAQRKYGKLVQMGTQQRSSPHTIEIVDKIHQGMIGALTLRNPGTSIRGSRLVWAKKCQCRRSLIGICGKVQRRAARIKIMSILITGIGSNFMARAKLSTTAHTKSMSAAGRSALIIRSVLQLREADTSSRDDWQFYDTLVTSFEYDDAIISRDGKEVGGQRARHRPKSLRAEVRRPAKRARAPSGFPRQSRCQSGTARPGGRRHA